MDTLTNGIDSGLLRHDKFGVVYRLKFSGNTSEVLRGDGTFGPYNPAINGALGWLLTGNSGTNPAINFLGTTDNIPFNVRVNNLRSGLIEITSGNTGWLYYISSTDILKQGVIPDGGIIIPKCIV